MKMLMADPFITCVSFILVLHLRGSGHKGRRGKKAAKIVSLFLLRFGGVAEEGA